MRIDVDELVSKKVREQINIYIYITLYAHLFGRQSVHALFVHG